MASARGNVLTLLERYRSSIFSRSAGTAAVSWTGSALSFVLGLVFARALGASGYGAYSYAIGWSLTLAMLANLGYERHLLRELAALNARESWSKMGTLIRDANIAVLATGVVLAVLAAGAGALLLEDPFRVPFLLAMPLVPIFGLIGLRRGVLQGLRSPELAQLPEQIIRPIVAASLIGVIYLAVGHELDPWIASAVTVIAGAAALGAAQRNTIKRLPGRIKKLSQEELAPFRYRPIWSFLILSVVFQGTFQLPQIVLGGVSTASEVAFYSVAATASALTAVALNGVNVTLAPLMSTFHDQSKLNELQRLVTRGARIGFGGTLMVGGIIVLVRQPVLALYGAEFQNASPVILILLAGQVFNVASGPGAMLLMMAGRQKIVAVAGATGSLLCIAVTMKLGPSMGAEGAAIGAISSIIAWNLIVCALSWRILKINTTIFGGLSYLIRR